MEPAAAKTFDEYSQHVFTPYISSQLRSVSRVHLVRDTYNDDSLKGTARAKRGNGVRRSAVGKASEPGNLQNFLRVDSNKRELFNFQSKVLLQASCKEDKEVVFTDGKEVLSIQLLQMSTPWFRAATKKLIVVCYYTYHTLHSIGTPRCPFALLTPMS